MLRTSISPEINALGAVMIVITIALPLVGGFMIHAGSAEFDKKKRTAWCRSATNGGMMDLGDGKRYQRLLEAYESGDVDRRTLLKIIGGMAAAVGVVGLPGRGLQPQRARRGRQHPLRRLGQHRLGSLPQFRFPAVHREDRHQGGRGRVRRAPSEFLSLVKAARPGDYNIFLVSGVYDYARFCKAGFGEAINEANTSEPSTGPAGDPRGLPARSPRASSMRCRSTTASPACL